MKVLEGSAGRWLVISLERDEDLYDGILAGCRAHGLRDAVVTSGVATLSPVVLHDVTTDGFPIGENVRTLSGPWELTALSGLVIDGEVHAHLAVANSDTATGGHLHPGTRVLYLAEVVVVELQLTGAVVRREHEAGTNLWLIREGAPAPTQRPG